jgi:hypothetical protein
VGFTSGLWAGRSTSRMLLSANHSIKELDVWQGALSCCYRQSSSLNLSYVSLDVWQVSRTAFFNIRRSLSLNAAYPVVVLLWLCFHNFHLTIMPPTVDLGNLRRVAVSLTNFLLMQQPITSPRSKSLSSLNLPVSLVLLSNEQHTSFCII